jgi:hypothetical protein
VSRLHRRRPALLLLLILAFGACGSSAHQRYLVSGSASPAIDLKSFIPTARQFVEQHRGLKFKTPVPVTALSDSDFNKKLLDKQSNDTTSIDKAAKELEAMGLISGHPNLAALEKSLLSTAVTGFYDPKEKQLFVRGVKPTPYVREVIVHELTHGLQDQYFGIDRPLLQQANDERAEAFLGLIEGDAVRIETQYRSSLSADEQQQAQQEENQGAAGVPADIPPVLIELLGFPYIYGPKFVEAVLAARGQTGLDSAFASPPSTTQQVVHPEKFLSHDTGQTVPKPVADATAFDDGILGEQGLDLLMEKAVSSGSLSGSDAAAASQDWNGDHYVAWDQGSGVSCVRTTFAARDSQAGRELATALEAYASTLGNATIESTSPLTVKSCSG